MGGFSLKGCICLDIDGTLTADPYSIPQKVWECLEALYAKGWHILFSTGRPYSFAEKLFIGAKFPFLLSVQNGADLLQMPEKKLLFQDHLSALFIPKLEELYAGIKEDFLIYAGFAKGDFCYYRPGRFSLKMLEHLEVVKSVVQEPWKAQEEFAFESSDSFPLIKSLGSKKQMEDLAQKLLAFPEVHASCICDPLSKKEVYLNLITTSTATKGEVVKKVRSMLPPNAFFIGAGDDRNDIPMLKEVDFAIVMENAPEELFPLADLLAKPAKEYGIIEALWRATGETRC